MDFEDVLNVWVRTHDEFEKHQDVLEQAANKLYHDRILDDRYWEGVLLSR